MKLFPEDRRHLARGELGALFNWWGDTWGLWLCVCLVVGFVEGWFVGGMCCIAFVVVSLLIIARELYGEHLYQRKTFGKSDFDIALEKDRQENNQ